MFEYIIHNTGRLHTPLVQYHYTITYRYTTDKKTKYFKGDFVGCFHSLNIEFKEDESISNIKVFKKNTKTHTNKCIFDLNL